MIQARIICRYVETLCSILIVQICELRPHADHVFAWSLTVREYLELDRLQVEEIEVE
jgi:hypothetical protein